MREVLQSKQDEWDEKHPNPSPSYKKKNRPKYTAKDFYEYCSKIPGPLKGKPYPSSTVLIKVALNLHPKVRQFLARKFAGSQEEAECANLCFTRNALGTGTFWNPANVTPEIQLYWVESMFAVQQGRKSRFDSKVAFKGDAQKVKNFENLCKLNLEQLKLMTANLDDTV